MELVISSAIGATMERDDDGPDGEAAAPRPTLEEWMEMLALGRFSGPLRDAGVESVEVLAQLSAADLEKSCCAAGIPRASC